MERNKDIAGTPILADTIKPLVRRPKFWLPKNNLLEGANEVEWIFSKHIWTTLRTLSRQEFIIVGAPSQELLRCWVEVYISGITIAVSIPISTVCSLESQLHGNLRLLNCPASYCWILDIINSRLTKAVKRNSSLTLQQITQMIFQFPAHLQSLVRRKVMTMSLTTISGELNHQTEEVIQRKYSLVPMNSMTLLARAIMNSSQP